MDRDDIIEHLVGLYREVLEEKDDEDLLGDSLEEVRETTIEEILERYQDDLEAMTDEQLEEQCR